MTYALTVEVGELLSRLNQQMIFIYVSGFGTDSSERGSTEWARVKGRTENALLKLPFRAAYMFRPGFIEPLGGIKSKTTSYRVFYTLATPIIPCFRWAFPEATLDTSMMGKAMLAAAKSGAPKSILEVKDIRALAQSWRAGEHAHVSEIG